MVKKFVYICSMKTLELGQEVIDTRDGNHHIIIDQEYINSIDLIYTDTKTSIPSVYLIDTDSCLLSHFIFKKLNNLEITDWMNNNIVIRSFQVDDKVDKNTLRGEIIKSQNKYQFSNKSIWGNFTTNIRGFLRL